MPKHSKKVTETVARPTRTTIMLAIAVALVTFWDQHIAHLSHRQDALLGISQYALALGIALAAVNAAWVAVENRLGAGLLRSVPPKKVDVVDTPDRRGQYGAGELNLVLLVLAIVLIVVVLVHAV